MQPCLGTSGFSRHFGQVTSNWVCAISWIQKLVEAVERCSAA